MNCCSLGLKAAQAPVLTGADLRDNPARFAGLAPIVDDQTTVLILGSFPGRASLSAQQYYGHVRNQFWAILEHVTGTPMVGLPYVQKVAALRACRIGLWDVIGACEREGSLDSAIREPSLNDFGAIFARAPDIRLIALNGAKAASYGKLLMPYGKAMVTLPSSSPANATHSLAFKKDRWAALLKDV